MSAQTSAAARQPSRFWLWLGVVAALQTAALLWMVVDRNRVLSSGTEVVLPVIPVDPRSLFQGDYVRLGYEIGASLPDNDGISGARRPVFAVLAKAADGTWSRVAVAPVRPASVAPDQVVLAGSQRWNQAEFGIETFFVPEGKGPELEKLIGDKKLSAVLRVDASGRAALAGLLVDGQPAYREPWY